MEKLNGRNYREWAQSIKLVGDGKGKIGCLIGDVKHPWMQHFNKKWKSKNFMVLSWLVNSMKSSIVKIYLFMASEDIWDVV